MKMIISTYWGDGEYKDRIAHVGKNEEGFYVTMYLQDGLVEKRPLYEHSERYAEDCAENYVMGILEETENHKEKEKYSNIPRNNIQQENLGLTSIDFGFGGQLDYEYPLSFLILKATVGFDIVIGGKLIFKNNNENYLINNSNKKVTTGWSGFRTGIGIVIPIN